MYMYTFTEINLSNYETFILIHMDVEGYKRLESLGQFT
jgi:hypothetical protein